MFSKGSLVISFFAIIGLTMTSFTCTEPAEPNFTILPPLTDEIPYDVLGQGKLVFRRGGPIYVIDIDEQTSWGIDVGGIHSPAVSPDGERIAYTDDAGYEAGTLYDVYVMNIDGTNSENVSKIPGVDRRPSWTPDSQQILFYVWAYPDFYDTPIFRQSPISNPSDRVLIQKFELGPQSPVSVSVSNKLVFVKGDSAGSRIYTMNIDGSGLAPLTPSCPYGRTWFSPSFSPNGDKIAYLSVTGSNLAFYESLEIVVIDADGSNPISLALFEIGSGQTLVINDVLYGTAISLCWSPDGSKIAFTKLKGNFVSHIFTINSDGTGLTQITSAEGVTDKSLSWSD